MAHLIDKDALVAEIEKKIKQYEDAFNNPSFASYEACLIAKGKYRLRKDSIPCDCMRHVLLKGRRSYWP